MHSTNHSQYNHIIQPYKKITEEIEDIDDEAFDVTGKSLSEFLTYLKSHIKIPCQLMNIKHF